jgi:ribulose-5-phosphate 4-epimerase/fuculose-1-phosphate aldolase
VGKTIADAFLNMYIFEAACTVQVRAMAGGAALRTINPAIIDNAMEQAKVVTKSLGGLLAWPALLRKLEREDASYRS